MIETGTALPRRSAWAARRDTHRSHHHEQGVGQSAASPACVARRSPGRRSGQRHRPMAMIKPIPVTSLPRARPRPDNDWRNAQVCPSSILRVAAHFPLCGPDLACDGELDVASTPWKFLSRWREGLSRRDLPCGTKLCRRCVSRITIIKVESPETKRRHESQSARPTVSMLTSKATAR